MSWNPVTITTYFTPRRNPRREQIVKTFIRFRTSKPSATNEIAHMVRKEDTGIPKLVQNTIVNLVLVIRSRPRGVPVAQMKRRACLRYSAKPHFFPQQSHDGTFHLPHRCSALNQPRRGLNSAFFRSNESDTLSRQRLTRRPYTVTTCDFVARRHPNALDYRF